MILQNQVFGVQFDPIALLTEFLLRKNSRELRLYPFRPKKRSFFDLKPKNGFIFGPFLVLQDLTALEVPKKAPLLK